MYISIRITKPNINTFYLLHNIIKYYKRKPVIHFTMPFFKFLSLSLLEKKKKNDRKILHRDDKELQRQEWEILVRIEWKLNCVTLLFSSLPLFLPFDFPPSLPPSPLLSFFNYANGRVPQPEERCTPSLFLRSPSWLMTAKTRPAHCCQLQCGPLPLREE